MRPRFAHRVNKLMFGVGAAPQPDHDDASTYGERVEVRRDVRCADELEHDVEGAALDERIRGNYLGSTCDPSDGGDIVA